MDKLMKVSGEPERNMAMGHRHLLLELLREDAGMMERKCGGSHRVQRSMARQDIERDVETQDSPQHLIVHFYYAIALYINAAWPVAEQL